MKKDVVKLVTFRLGSDLFAANVHSVERVLRFATPATVPDVPQWIEGVLPYRDVVIPVVDMRRRIGLAATETTPETRILVFSAADGWVGGNKALVIGREHVAPLGHRNGSHVFLEFVGK